MSLTHIVRGALIVLLGLSLAACSQEGEKAQGGPGNIPPTNVVVLTVKRENIPITITAMGQTMGYLSVEVRAQVAGILKRRAYKEGDYVKQGQLLFEIDPAAALAALEQANGQLAVARANYDNARRELDRIVPLYQRNAVSQKDRDSAQSAYESAKASVESAQGTVNEAQIRLQYTNVTAPISGFTSRETRNEGNLITLDAQGSLLTTINQTDPMYLSFAIPSSDVLYMRRLESQGRARMNMNEMGVTMSVLDGDQYPFEGQLAFMDTQIDPTTSVLRAKAEFPNPDTMLLPGQFATVTVRGSELVDALMIPQRAVLQTAQGPKVYLVNKENKVELVPVKLGQTFGSMFLLEGGLEGGERLMVDGISKVLPGQTVNATEVEKTMPASLPSTDSIAHPVPQGDIENQPSPALPGDLQSASGEKAE